MGPKMLIILDGFGYSEETFYNAIFHAKTPNIDAMLKTYPNTNLCASGGCVGLLDGYIGNSEVGHMTIGAGRVIKQPIARIHNAIRDKSFFSNDILVKAMKKIKNAGRDLHIMGLLSDAGVHGHIEHLYAFLLAARKEKIEKVYVHAFLDGRDVAPKTAAQYLNNLTQFMIEEQVGSLASIHGRFYAMDRDKNWDRTEKSYRVLIGRAEGSDQFLCENHMPECECWKDLLEASYQQNITDEFIVPVQLDSTGVIENGDGIVFFNFRPDRARQLTASFVDPKFSNFNTEGLLLSCFVTPVRYSSVLQTDVMFEREKIENSFSDVLIKSGKRIFAIAETEKYAHVTYFFNGGREQKYKNEKRVLVPSLGLKSYAEAPKMSAENITAEILRSLRDDPYDFYIVNYANADMVGHSGNFEATIKAIECLDGELKKLYDEVVEKMEGTMYVTADHGNAEQMFDEYTGQPHTAHTTNLVPFILLQEGLEKSSMKLPLTQLADIAPFILQNMGLDVPLQMKR